jgi:CheY-like chemotaxis protein
MDKKKILLVENENVTAMDIKSDLIRLGYEVPTIVSRGDDAIRMTTEVRPDLILLDIALEDRCDRHVRGVV